MEGLDRPGNRVLAATGDSVFSRVTRLARRYEAINLGQGFPDFRPPDALTNRLHAAAEGGFDRHQYAPSPGRRDLRRRLADLHAELYGLDCDPDGEITVTAGATEAIASALLGLLNPGDRIVVFEPVYDQYVPLARRAGAEVVRLALRDGFRLPLDRLEAVLRKGVRLIVLNHPHNPTGRVFRREPLEDLVERARRHDAWILSDEVYEHHVFGPVDYVPLINLEGARKRTLRVGSAGKSFDATGWKTGWILAPPPLTRAVRGAHQFVTFCAANPLQAALASYLGEEDALGFFEELRSAYRRRRDVLLEGLEDSPLRAEPPEGTYFMVARVPAGMWPEGEDSGMRFVRRMVEEAGVAALPLSSFVGSDGEETVRGRLRLAFCKQTSVLAEAARRLTHLG